MPPSRAEECQQRSEADDQDESDRVAAVLCNPVLKTYDAFVDGQQTKHMDECGEHDQQQAPCPVGVPGKGSSHRKAYGEVRNVH